MNAKAMAEGRNKIDRKHTKGKYHHYSKSKEDGYMHSPTRGSAFVSQKGYEVVFDLPIEDK